MSSCLGTLPLLGPPIGHAFFLLALYEGLWYRSSLAVVIRRANCSRGAEYERKQTCSRVSSVACHFAVDHCRLHHHCVHDCCLGCSEMGEIVARRSAACRHWQITCSRSRYPSGSLSRQHHGMPTHQKLIGPAFHVRVIVDHDPDIRDERPQGRAATRNARPDRIPRAEPRVTSRCHNSTCDFVSHPNDPAQQPAHAGAALKLREPSTAWPLCWSNGFGPPRRSQQVKQPVRVYRLL